MQAENLPAAQRAASLSEQKVPPAGLPTAAAASVNIDALPPLATNVAGHASIPATRISHASQFGYLRKVQRLKEVLSPVVHSAAAMQGAQTKLDELEGLEANGMLFLAAPDELKDQILENEKLYESAKQQCRDGEQKSGVLSSVGVLDALAELQEDLFGQVGDAEGLVRAQMQDLRGSLGIVSPAV